MKYFLFILFLKISILADVTALIGESGTVESDVMSNQYKDMELTNSNSCNCSGNIIPIYNKIVMKVDNYTNTTIDSLKKLREQVAKNKKELSNRSDNISNDEYYDTLNKTIKYINSDISNHKDISKIKLSGYNNLLLLSNNGFLYKNNNLLNVYSAINELEQLENKLEILKVKE